MAMKIWIMKIFGKKKVETFDLSALDNHMGRVNTKHGIVLCQIFTIYIFDTCFNIQPSRILKTLFCYLQ